LIVGEREERRRKRERERGAAVRGSRKEERARTAATPKNLWDPLFGIRE